MKHKIEKAPTVREIQNLEERQKKEKLTKRHEREVELKNEKNRIDNRNAEPIIEQLSEMFLNKKVSSRKGCSICGIPSNMCSDAILQIINNYLDGEWLPEFEINTGNAHDFEMTNTLVVKPLN